jgi:hypothetical protein
MYREIVQQGENVFLANMHDEWMSALGKLLEDKSLPTQIGLAGRQRGGQTFLDGAESWQGLAVQPTSI